MLATHKRKRDSFESMFQVSAKELIEKMSDTRTDVAEHRPKYETKLTKVGIQRDNIPVNITDPLDENLTHQFNFNITISVPLEEMKRGIHVSRMGNAIAESSAKRVYSNIVDFTEDVAKSITESQGSQSCFVRALGTYTFIEIVEGWKKEKEKKSIEAIPLIAETNYSKNDEDSFSNAGLRVAHMTACPCVQAALNTMLSIKKTHNITTPFTHSQRCETEIMFNYLAICFNLKDIIRVVDTVVTRTQNTLPREHELALVNKSHSNPTFLEDVVRGCAMEVYENFKSNLRENGFIKVSSISQESIHSYDLHAEAQYPLDISE